MNLFPCGIGAVSFLASCGEAHDTSLVHDKRVPPPHNYLATYFWLQEAFRANAMVHFGTHGTEFMLPGKPTGLSRADWPDIVMGTMPNINPWIINNLGESSPARRRAYAVLIDHLVPPSVNAELSDELLNLHNETTPVSLHVFGEPPRDDLLVPWIVTCLRKPFRDGLGEIIEVPAEEALNPGDRQKYLRQRAEEIVTLVLRQGFGVEEAIQSSGGKLPLEELPESVQKGMELALRLNENFA